MEKRSLKSLGGGIILTKADPFSTHLTHDRPLPRPVGKKLHAVISKHNMQMRQDRINSMSLEKNLIARHGLNNPGATRSDGVKLGLQRRKATGIGKPLPRNQNTISC